MSEAREVLGFLPAVPARTALQEPHRTPMRPHLLLLPLLLLLGSCAFHSTSTRFNGRVGPNGKPVFVKSTSSVGLNLFIVLRLFGATDMGGILDEVTEDIAEEGGDRVRVIQSDSENYWYGFPPLTWIFTPVVTTVAAEYEPSPEDLAEALAEDGEAPAEDAEDAGEPGTGADVPADGDPSAADAQD